MQRTKTEVELLNVFENCGICGQVIDRMYKSVCFRGGCVSKWKNIFTIVIFCLVRLIRLQNHAVSHCMNNSNYETAARGLEEKKSIF